MTTMVKQRVSSFIIFSRRLIPVLSIGIRPVTTISLFYEFFPQLAFKRWKVVTYSKNSEAICARWCNQDYL